MNPETELETKIMADAEWQAGVEYGEPRPGHPEGKVIKHIEEVLKNIEEFFPTDPDRADLRVIALLHDTFKGKVDYTKSRVGENKHGVIARKFAEKFDLSGKVLEIIEVHDESYAAWCEGEHRGNWDKADQRLAGLLERLKKADATDLFRKFYLVDNSTGDKTMEPYEWFLAKAHHIKV